MSKKTVTVADTLVSSVKVVCHAGVSWSK